MSNHSTNLQAANVVKLQELIHRGAVSAQKVLERVMNDVPSDTLSPMGEMHFGIDYDKLAMTVAGKTMSLHRHALMQLSEDTGLPQKFLATFPERGAWGRELVADALERTFRNGVDPKKRLLVRHVRGEARGILSDRYHRLDSGLLLESFVKAIAGTGIQPYEGLATDTRFTIQCVEDKLYYPVPGEAHAMGLTFGHSDYGDGALEVRAFFMRLACTNGMMAKNHMRQVHIGTKLSEDIMWSERTFRADSELSASKLADTIASVVDPEVIDLEFNKLTQAYEERIDPKKAAESAAKALGSKETAKAIAEAFNGADVENMPAGNTRARWANAISWVANASDDAARKLQLQGYAAEVIGLAPPGAGRTPAFGELPTAIVPCLVPAS